MGYQGIAAKGFSWIGILRLFVRGTSFIRLLILARLLTPAQFGLFGIATLVLGLLEMLTETGINVVLIQGKDEQVTKQYLNTAWVISVVRGSLITLILLFASPLIVTFYRQTEALSLLLLISLVPLIRGFINPAVVSFQKQLQFHREFIYRGSLTLIDAAASITLAFMTRSPISLIWGLVIAALAEVAISFTFIKPIPAWKFSLTQCRKILKSGIWITFTGTINYLYLNGPDLVIGRLLNSASLGVYQMAYRLGFIPAAEIGEVTNRVTFPIYVQIYEDRQRARSASAKHTLLLLSISLPITLIFIIFPGILVRVLLGPAWSGVIPVLPIMGVSVFISSLVSPASSYLLAIKRQDRMFIFNLIRTASLLLLIVPLVQRYQLIGGPLALLISAGLALPYTVYAVYQALYAANHHRHIGR